MAERITSVRVRRISILVPCLVILSTGLLLGEALRRSHRATAEVSEGYEELRALDRLRLRLVEAETAQRGFLITGSPEALDRAAGAEVEVEVLIDALVASLEDSPVVLDRLEELRHLTSERLAMLHEGIERRREADVGAPEVRDLAVRGSALMAEIGSLLDRIESGRRRDLDARRAVEARQFQGVIAILVLGMLLVLTATFATLRNLAGLVGELARLNHELGDKNTVLEDQAAELEAQAEELQAQTQRLHQTSAALEAANQDLTDKSMRLEEFSSRLEGSNAELTRVNEMLVERTAEAEEANRTKRDFLAVMSHELRTPLNAIAGYAEILQMGLHGPVTEAQMASLDRIRRNQEYLLSLITDVLTFAKEESGRIEVRMADVSVVDLIRDVQERIEPQVMAKGLRYDYELPDASVRVRGDRQRIEQILLNLLGNAIKFTDRGGAVTLACESAGERVQLRVADTGCGIPPEQAARIFDPYVQAHGEASAREGGAGLGLAISRQLARRMGGDLMVESTPGTGSVFTLELVRGYRVADASLFPREMAIFAPEGEGAHRPGMVPEPRSDSAAAS